MRKAKIVRFFCLEFFRCHQIIKALNLSRSRVSRIEYAYHYSCLKQIEYIVLCLSLHNLATVYIIFVLQVLRLRSSSLIVKVCFTKNMLCSSYVTFQSISIPLQTSNIGVKGPSLASVYLSKSRFVQVKSFVCYICLSLVGSSQSVGRPVCCQSLGVVLGWS